MAWPVYINSNKNSHIRPGNVRPSLLLSLFFFHPFESANLYSELQSFRHCTSSKQGSSNGQRGLRLNVVRPKDWQGWWETDGEGLNGRTDGPLEVNLSAAFGSAAAVKLCPDSRRLLGSTSGRQSCCCCCYCCSCCCHCSCTSEVIKASHSCSKFSQCLCVCVCVCVRRLSNVKRRKQIFRQKVAVAWGAVFIAATQRGRGVL